MKCQLFVWLACLGSSSALFYDWVHKWDALKVQFSMKIFAKGFDNSMPRTAAEAVKTGFEQVGKCDDLDSHRGNRYVKDGDESVVLLYDKNGYIAGIQTVIPDNLPNGYPEVPIRPPFIKVGSKYFLTAYFVDPSKICSTGRRDDEFKVQGTGTRLLIQTGPNPDKDLMHIPHRQSDLASTKWVKGKCFFTMGTHFWHDVSRDMECSHIFPVFLLYNRGRLNAFGWFMQARLSSRQFERPPGDIFKRFINVVPTCLRRKGVNLSTLHIFLTSNLLSNDC